MRAFIDWVRPYVRGECPFPHRFTMQKRRREWYCDSLWQAHERYEWNGSNFAVNQAELECLAGVEDADRLAQVGDWLIECETADDLLARFEEWSSS